MHAVWVLLASYAVGAIPFSNIAARFTVGRDLRDVGGGTVSGTNLFRVAGFVPLALAGVFEVAKGAAGPLLAGANEPGLAALAGGLAVAGHDWSPFLRFAGGRGISPAVGALLVGAWPGAALLLAGMAAGRSVRQTGLGSFVAFVLLVPVTALTYGSDGALMGAAVLVPLVAKRLVGDHPASSPRPSVYAHRLVFDCDPVEGASR